MIRNLKRSCLGLVVLIAIGAAGVSAAQAAVPVLTTEGGVKVKLDGTQTEANVFNREGRTIQCEVANAESEAENLATTLTMKAAGFEKCQSSIGPATVTMNGCDYLIHVSADPHEPEDTWTGKIDFVCPAGKQLEIHIYSSEANHSAGTSVCTYTYGSQNNLSLVELTNEPASSETPKNWILADIKISHITSTEHGSTLICGQKEDTNGTLTGGISIKGTNAATSAKVGITISTH